VVSAPMAKLALEAPRFWSDLYAETVALVVDQWTRHGPNMT
jgi:hypothetical protein